MVNKTVDCFRNIIFILVSKINSKKVCEKMENNSMLQKVLLVCNREAEVAEEEKFDNSEKFCRKKLRHFLFYLFVVVDI